MIVSTFRTRDCWIDKGSGIGIADAGTRRLERGLRPWWRAFVGACTTDSAQSEGWGSCTCFFGLEAIRLQGCYTLGRTCRWLVDAVCVVDH